MSVIKGPKQPSGRPKEGDVLSVCRNYLKKWGWKVYRHQQGMGSLKGFPDLTAIRDGITIYVEIKTHNPRSKQSDDQIKFELEITKFGGLYMVARGIEDLEQFGHGWEETKNKMIARMGI